MCTHWMHSVCQNSKMASNLQRHSRSSKRYFHHSHQLVHHGFVACLWPSWCNTGHALWPQDGQRSFHIRSHLRISDRGGADVLPIGVFFNGLSFDFICNNFCPHMALRTLFYPPPPPPLSPNYFNSISPLLSQVPKGFECTFFGAYEVTDKGSSWVAPLIAALIMSSTKTTCGVQQDGNVFQLISVSIPATSSKKLFLFTDSIMIITACSLPSVC